VCVAFFIKSDKALGLKGDGRDFSSSSDPGQSRAYIHVDVANKSFTSHVNPTCTTGGNCKAPLSGNQLNVTFGDDGSFSVSASLQNSVIPLSPSIDANVTFTPNASGSYTASGSRDAFPSFEAYHYQNGKASTIVQRPEKTPFHLIPLFPNDEF
jgi:hypothetical protein